MQWGVGYDSPTFVCNALHARIGDQFQQGNIEDSLLQTTISKRQTFLPYINAQV